MEVAVADVIGSPHPVDRGSNPIRDRRTDVLRDSIHDATEPLPLGRKLGGAGGVHGALQPRELPRVPPQPPRSGDQQLEHRGTVDAIRHETEPPFDLDQSVLRVGREDRRARDPRPMDAVRDPHLAQGVLSRRSDAEQPQRPALSPGEDLGRAPLTDAGQSTRRRPFL